MEVPLHAQDPRLSRLDPFLLIPPLPRQLQRSLDGLCTGVHREDHVVSEELSDGLRKGAEERVVECTGREGELLSLGDKSGDNFRVTVAL